MVSAKNSKKKKPCCWWNVQHCQKQLMSESTDKCLHDVSASTYKLGFSAWAFTSIHTQTRILSFLYAYVYIGSISMFHIFYLFPGQLIISMEFFFNTIFLFIIWEFHTMHPDDTHFPFPPGPPSNPCVPLQKEKNTSSPIWVAYILIEEWSTPQWPVS